MNDFKKKFENLNKEKQDVLKKEIEANGNEYNLFPLSTEQKQMWLLYLMDTQSPYYNVPFLIKMKGKLDIGKLNDSINLMRNKQQVLISKILKLGEEVYVYIDKDWKNKIEELQVVELDVSKTKEQIEQEYSRPFNLEEEFPMRVTLFKHSNNDFTLYVNIHHMFIDGWSVGLFLKELKNSYSNQKNTTSLDFEYVDYSTRENNSDRTTEIQFWEEHLKMANFNLNLPYSFPRLKKENRHAKNYTITLENKNAVQEFCKKNKISIFCYFFTIYYLSLNRICNQENITIGTPVLNRDTEEIKKILGYFSNTLPINVSTKGINTLNDLFNNINTSIFECIGNSKVHFSEIVELQNAHRRDLNNPIFQTVFSLHNHSLTDGDVRSEAEVSGIKFSMDSFNGNFKNQFDLICTVTEKEENFQINLSFKRELFSDEMIMYIGRILENLVKKDFSEIYHLNIKTFMEEEILIQPNPLRFETIENKMMKLPNVKRCIVKKLKHNLIIYYASLEPIQDIYFKELLADYSDIKIIAIHIDDSIKMNQVENNNTIFKLIEKKINTTLDKFCQLESRNLLEIEKIELISKKEKETDISLISNISNLISKEDNKIVNSSNPSLLIGIEEENLPFNTIQEAILSFGIENSENTLVFINELGQETELSYITLLNQAKNISSNLMLQGLKSGDIALLVIENISDFIRTLWGCLLTGVIPVPITDALRGNNFKRLKQIYQLTEKPYIITSKKNQSVLESEGSFINEKTILFETLNRKSKNIFSKNELKPNDIAILLFTSGSTGLPKGVGLTHNNILNNQLKRSKEYSKKDSSIDRSVSLNWMPLNHVGGVVMFHLFDTLIGVNQVQVDCNFILANPIRWLILLDRYNVTDTWAPNFAYGLITSEREKVKKLDIDLSSVRTILNGGEAINFNATQEFLNLLDEKGLSNNVMRPSWGMTETSSGILVAKNFGDIQFKNSVSVGKPVGKAKVRVVDEKNNILKQNENGFLQVSGPTIFKEYFKNIEQTNDSFTNDGWFKTGDLAMIIDNQVVITGRAKEVIVINGKNYSCLEVEKELEEIPEIISGGVACILESKIGSHSDKISIAFEERKPELRKKIVSAILERVNKEFSIPISEIIPIKSEDIPRTSIGKIDKKEIVSLRKKGALLSLKNSESSFLPNWFAETEFIEKKYPINFDDSFDIPDYYVYNIPSINKERLVDEVVQIFEKLIGFILENNSERLLITIKDSNPARKLIEGFATSIPKKFSVTSVKIIVYDSAILEEKYLELESLNMTKDYSLIQYKEGKRFEEIIKDIKTSKKKIVETNLIPGSFYIILGGLGGIGKYICEYLLTRYQLQLAIVGKSDLRKSVHKKEIFNDLKKMGDVTYYQSDASNAGNILNVLNKIDQSNEGRIVGILNLIGENYHIEGNSSNIQNIDESLITNLNVRINTVNEIDEFLLDKSNIKVVQFTSLTGLFGGQNLEIYSATSKFLYDFELKNKENSLTSIAWSKWPNIGMSTKDTDDDNRLTKNSGYHLIKPIYGITSMEYVLSAQIKKCLVGIDTENLLLNNFRYIEKDWCDMKVGLFAKTKNNFSLDKISNSLDYQITEIDNSALERKPFLSEVENRLLKIWTTVLGESDFEVTDNFFMVGGNSLKSIRLIEEINRKLNLDLNISILFKYSSIRELVNYLYSENMINIQNESEIIEI